MRKQRRIRKGRTSNKGNRKRDDKGWRDKGKQRDGKVKDDVEGG